MKFWALAYKYQEDVFNNLATDEDTMDLTMFEKLFKTETC